MLGLVAIVAAAGCGHGDARRRDAGGDRRDAAPRPALVDAAIVADAAVVADADAAAVDATPAAPADDDWLDVAVALPDVVLDLRYATAHNLTGAPIYPQARCLLRRAVVDRLARAVRALAAHDRRLVLWDCYRPASLQAELWRRVPDPRFVAPPRYDADGHPIAGSRHSRGAAIDASLADGDGAPLVMPTDHDDFTAAASGARATGDAARHLALLRAALTGAGFTPLASEWWHFDAPDASRYPLADQPLDTDLVRSSPR